MSLAWAAAPLCTGSRHTLGAYAKVHEVVPYMTHVTHNSLLTTYSWGGGWCQTAWVRGEPTCLGTGGKHNLAHAGVRASGVAGEGGGGMAYPFAEAALGATATWALNRGFPCKGASPHEEEAPLWPSMPANAACIGTRRRGTGCSALHVASSPAAQLPVIGALQRACQCHAHA